MKSIPNYLNISLKKTKKHVSLSYKSYLERKLSHGFSRHECKMPEKSYSLFWNISHRKYIDNIDFESRQFGSIVSIKRLNDKITKTADIAFRE